MPKRGENIFQRKDGRWEARYVKGYELSGKIKYGFCYGRTYREAKAKVEKLKAALLNGTPPPAPVPRRRFASYCEEWLGAQRSRIKESTYAKYEATLRRHILPKLGGYYPLGFSTQTVEAFKAGLLEEGLSVQSVKSALTVLRAVLRYAAEQAPGAFPPVEIRYPREAKKEPRVLTREEQRRFAAYLQEEPDPCKFGVLLALMTGLRIGELCALKWENLSLREGTLRVCASMQRVRDPDGGGDGGGRTKILIGEPKSESSARTIPLPDSIAPLCRRQDPQRPGAYVLTGTEDYMEPRKLQRRLKRYTQDCGLEGVHFHTLRHSFATRCMEAGFEIKSLSEVLGHAKTSTTLDRYVHSSLEVKRANMAKLTLSGL